MARGLTQQQENFCKAYIKTGIGYKAYLEAYPNAKTWKRNSVDVEATKMLNSPKISHRINELNNEIESTLKTSTALNKRKILEEIVRQYTEASANGGAERSNSVNLLKLMAQISKLIGDNAPTVNVNVQNNTVVGEVSDYLGL